MLGDLCLSGTLREDFHHGCGIDLHQVLGTTNGDERSVGFFVLWGVLLKKPGDVLKKTGESGMVVERSFMLGGK